MSSVLIVDDDERMVATLTDILSARQYAVSTAASWASALAQMRRDTFDVVRMDIRMPGLNGVEALQVMKRTTPAVKVIMMTAFMRDEMVEQARKSSAVAVVHKPLDLDNVLAMVARVVGPGGDGALGAR